ncbi:LSU ribosomal protein L4P [Verrucomicrobium sp. GAS474]|uniref:50S ribosomal protein L4 n=1 Tax=Verrucomicrobium sp. GAS474 TaxID=1882831 RepID=UPI00087C2A60|nr:50S ribosomal protein L4 [Verrucomicrobium sp. GAS474]SDU26181.1 LSU ribosomal protein L4P [Verrucomicrobium sp. GAS474]
MSKATPLTLETAGKALQVELIANGKGTQALHDTIVAYRANRRAGTRGTKTKATVNKSGKKPWRQKGTGRARAGYASSPIWRGGGVVFGPQNRDFSKITPKKVKQLALKKAISERAKDESLILVEALELKDAKTKNLVALLEGFKIEGSVLIVLAEANDNIYLASRNHLALEAVTADSVNAEDLLRFDKIVLTQAALDKIAARLK